MGSRSNKPILNVASATNVQAVSGLRDRLENVRLVGKRWSNTQPTWLIKRQKSKVPRAIPARRSQLESAQMVNGRGAKTSISRLLVSKDRIGDIVKDKITTAKTKIAGSIKKVSSFSKTDGQREGMFGSFRRKLGQNSQPEGVCLSEVEVESEVAAEADHSEQKNLDVQESGQISIAVETRAEPPILTPRKQLIQETPAECLTCEKLVHCGIRAQISAKRDYASQDIAPCRLLGITT